MTETIEKAISKAKIGMMQMPDTVFFSTLCISLETVVSQHIPTAATDGVKLYINPEFFLKATPSQRIFTLAHETLHVAYLHALRLEGRDQEVFNQAADHVINLELKSRGFSLFDWVLQDPAFTGMSAEKVYEHLIQNPEDQKSTGMEDLLPPQEGVGTGDVKTILTSMQHEIMEKISRAAMMAEMANAASSIPDFIKRELTQLSKPKVNWKSVLVRFFSDAVKTDYSWRKPNRRYMPLYLPKLSVSTLGRVDFAIDTSGSVDGETFNSFVSEVHGVLRLLMPKEMGVYQFDHVLQHSAVVRSIRDIKKMPFMGGGGTNPQVAIDEFAKNKAMALIILTDGYFRHYQLTDPKRPVIWIIYDNPDFKAPFGKAVHIKL